tara:strand:- start:50 stop:2344 length:2295 start_codon:yes stop_codon:yes gene_type:complete
MAAAGNGRIVAVLLAVLMLGITTSTSSSANSANAQEDVLESKSLQLVSGEIHNLSFEAQSGWFWIEALCSGNCQGLEMELIDSSETIHSATVTSSAHMQVLIPAGNTTISMKNNGDEIIELDLQASLPEINSLSESHGQSDRADSAPLNFASSEDKNNILKENPDYLSDPDATWLNATLEEAGEIYWPFEAEQGDLIEMVLLHTSDELSLEIQSNDSEYSSIVELSTPSNTSAGSSEQRIWIGLDEGKYWLVANSSQSEVSFTARIAHHSASSDTESGDWPSTGEANTVQELDDEGMANNTGILGNHDTDVLIINASGLNAWNLVFRSTAELNVTCEALVDGIWVSLTPMIELYQVINKQENMQFWSLESTELFRFTFTSNQALIWALETSRQTYSDYGMQSDAPGNIPWNQSVAVENFYDLPMEDGDSYSGWLTTSIYDGSDTYLINLVGWEESRFRVRVKLFADNELVSAEIIEMDWGDRSIVSNTTTPKGTEEQTEASLEIGPGLHLIRIKSLQITDSLANWSWGDFNQTPIPWTIQVEYIQTEEGEEPWFEAEDFVFDVSEALLWFLGMLLLMPMVMVLWNYRAHARQAERLAADKERLIILRELLAKGEVKQARLDLKTSLRTIASLEWNTGIKTWGKPDLRHRTDDLELVLWKLPLKLSKSSGTPILLGINIINDEWEVAAIRFESSSGEHWKILRCQPKLLFREDELFLDTLAAGSKTFLHVELSGQGEGLELSLSGLVGGEPTAAKPSRSITLEEE